jgi:hypothetical protein
MRREAEPPYFGKIISEIETATNAAANSNPSSRAPGSRPGRGMDIDGPPGAAQPAAGNTPARSDQWVSPDSRFTAGTLTPGVFFLGVDSGSSDKKFIDVAKQLGLDALIVISVEVKTRRTGGAYSTTDAKVHNLKFDESQKTSSLNNESVAKARERERSDSDDPVEKELDKIFAKFSDVQLKTDAMPELSAEAVGRRVESISSDSNPLASIVEVVNYWRADLLEEAAAMDFISKATDEATAKALLTGTDEERKTALTTWIENNMDEAVDTSGNFR